MSERSARRALLRVGALATAVVLAFGGMSAALAQDDDPTSTSPVPTETSTPPTESTPPTSEPAPPSSTPTTESPQPTGSTGSPQPTESAEPTTEAPAAPAETPKAAVGKFTVKFIQDKNGNNQDDPGEEIVGLKVAVLNQATGAKAADFVSGSDGKIVFTGIPAGQYWGVFDTAWRLRGGQGGMPVYVPESDTGSGAIYFMEPGESAADLRGSLTFEKSSYESHETVRMTATVTNIGGQTAHRAKLMWSLSGVETAEEQWGDFGWRGAGIELASGESRTFQVSGLIRDISNGKVRPSTIIDWEGRPNPCQCGLSGEVIVVQTKGEISGVAYADKNRNGQQDAGEATAGVVVEANGGAPYGYFKTTTDADGRYSFKDLPSGDYHVGYTFTDGWVVHSDGTDSKIRVQPGQPVQLTARAERPYTESLSATLTLDKEVYQAGEDAKITITLTNSGDRELTNIQAWCNRIGDGDQLGGSPGGPATGWGELIPPGKGVTVGAGETKTFIATEKVPQASFATGRVIASCGFAPYAGWNSDAAEAFDSARVPGGFGSLSGDLYYDRNGNWTLDGGEAIGNTRIVLHDRELNVDVAETFSDAQGHVRFDRVPAGDFWARVDGPWKFEGEYGGHVMVRADIEGRTGFVVVPDTQAPPAPGGGGGNTPPPAAGGGSGDALAKTGASVLGLGLVGALLVAFGFGASLIGRRRLA
ncbi:SdrD B-like domain-containing protein [Lentzea sp. NPDC051838]|uniref:SdrD B-like domain-containing protein n=1 Tax=Lentzea sp. NPDC051838 TaxID=3154849 RepID=UPI003418B564